ncbi:uncharacterized protein LOC121519842 [Cheilinus undulatus]|uniref:uncharacterized protein LOC121519842 n=1 Tax=Cheilinus undulatus TaxID=241271 RepID=UPI001BD53DC1|nr:uncharacterized protein LOC121519842 [Cheilinus undulatus]
MEETAVQQDKMEGSWEGGTDGEKTEWKKNECSLSSLLKHSCLLCWSSPRETDAMEMDERVVAKAAEIRELENAVAVEHLELQEQQSDRKELEETLVKLDKHKDKLIQQIKTTRQLCYEESQKILSLQTEEVQKENQVEEYERELARARWRLRRLREEVKQAKRKVEEAGERNTPLQDSIRQSYEEILQEENTLCSLSGGAVTPESQLEESTSPADTTEDDPLPLKPWGRSQSLPAYADLIMRASGSSFCNNLVGTREEADDSGTSSTKMDRSDLEEDDPDDGEAFDDQDKDREKEETGLNPNPVSQLDFYQADPFAHCQSDHDLFNEDLFPKTDSSDGFASDPFKGSDPFAADVLFPEANVGANDGAGNGGDEADTSLSCAENKASTGTQCFESEFPDEDSDIEISYSREDLDAIGVAEDSRGFKPIQSSSEELGPEPIRGWRSQGQYSVESDPNGYELDLGAVSPPSDIEEHSLGSLAGETTAGAAGPQERGLCPGSAQDHGQGVLSEADWVTESGVQKQSADVVSSLVAASDNGLVEERRDPATPQNSVDCGNHPDSDQNKELSFEFETTSQSSFDPYGFKLSPEHSSHTLLDPDEAELSPEPNDNDLTFDPEPSSSQPDQLTFDPFGFEVPSSQTGQDFDPYGFKLSPEEENQEVLDLCNPRKQQEPSNYSNQEVLEPHHHENQEVLDQCSPSSQELLDPGHNRNQEVLETSHLDDWEVVSHKNQELLDLCSQSNQEVLNLPEPCTYLNQVSLGNRELLDFSHPENQEVLDVDHHGNQELLDFSSKGNQEVLYPDSHGHPEVPDLCSNENQEVVDLGSHDNQEVLDLFNRGVLPEANNNQSMVGPEVEPSPSNHSSDSDVTSDDLLGLELSNANAAVRNVSASQNFTTSTTARNLLEGDLGSVFGAGGYIGCPDVADDLEPLDRRQPKPKPEPARPVRPVRPPRPSLKAKEKAQSQTQGFDLK